MIVTAIIGLLAGVGGARFGAKASTGFAKNLREKMFNHIQSFSFSNIDKFSTAGLVTRLTTDVTNIQNAYQMILRMSVRSPISLICAMAHAYSIIRSDKHHFIRNLTNTFQIIRRQGIIVISDIVKMS